MDRLLFASQGVLTKVADMYPTFWIGSRAVALMGVRTHF
jgi:hypothetical protein